MRSNHSSSRFASLLNTFPIPSPSPSPSPTSSSTTSHFFRPHSPPWFLSDSPAALTSMPSHPPYLFRPIAMAEPLSPLPFDDIDSFLQHELSAPLPSPTTAAVPTVGKRADESVGDGGAAGRRKQGGRRGSDCSDMSTSSSPNSALSLSRTSSPQLSRPSSASSASSASSSTSSPQHSIAQLSLPSLPTTSSVTSSSSSVYGKLATKGRGRRSLQSDPAFHALPRSVRRKHGASCHMCKTTRPIDELLVCTAKAEQGKRKREFCLLRCHSIDVVRMTADEKDCWVCPACHSLCFCAACQRYEKHRAAEQATAGPTPTAASVVREVTDSASYISPRTARSYHSLRVDTRSSSPSLDTASFQSSPLTPLASLDYSPPPSSSHAPLNPLLLPVPPPRPSSALLSLTLPPPQRPAPLLLPVSPPSSTATAGPLFSPISMASGQCGSGSPFVPLLISRSSPYPFFNFPAIFPTPPQLFTAPPHCSSSRAYSWSEIQG